MLHGEIPDLGPATPLQRRTDARPLGEVLYDLDGTERRYTVVDDQENPASSQMDRSPSPYEQAPSLEFGRDDDIEVGKRLYGVEGTEELAQKLLSEFYADGGEPNDVISTTLK